VAFYDGSTTVYTSIKFNLYRSLSIYSEDRMNKDISFTGRFCFRSRYGQNRVARLSHPAPNHNTFTHKGCIMPT